MQTCVGPQMGVGSKHSKLSRHSQSRQASSSVEPPASTGVKLPSSAASGPASTLPSSRPPSATEASKPESVLASRSGPPSPMGDVLPVPPAPLASSSVSLDVSVPVVMSPASGLGVFVASDDDIPASLLVGSAHAPSSQSASLPQPDASATHNPTVQLSCAQPKRALRTPALRFKKDM